jgi:hypothetical protein
MLANLALTATAGFVYWVVVAQSYSSDEIGRAGALATSAMLVVFATNLGLTVAVGRHAGSRHGDDDARFTVAAALTVVSSVVGGLALFVVGPDRVVRAITGTEALTGEIVFLAIVAGMPLAQLVDIRLLALRRHRLVVARSGAAALLKVATALVVSLSDQTVGSVALFVGLLGPDALIGMVTAVPLAAPGARRMLATRALPPLRAAYHAARVNYVSVLFAQGATIAVPFVVIPHVTDTENANFYLAWGFTQIALLVPQSISWGLHVEGSAADLAAQVRTALRHGMAASAVATFGSMTLIVLMPAVYGSEYATGGRIAPLLMASSLPFTATSIWLVEARVLGHRRAEISIAAAFALGVVGGVTLLVARFGLLGAALGVLLGATAAALAAGGLRARPHLIDSTPAREWAR